MDHCPEGQIGQARYVPVLVPVVPGDAVLFVRDHGIGLDALRRDGPQRLEAHRHGQAILAGSFDLDHRPVGIGPHPHSQRRLRGSARDDDFAVVQMQRLPQRVPVGHRIGQELHADAAKFQKPLAAADVVAPGVGLAEIKQQVAALFHPHVQPEVAVAQWHRAAGILARSVPGDVITVDRTVGLPARGQWTMPDHRVSAFPFAKATHSLTIRGNSVTTSRPKSTSST